MQGEGAASLVVDHRAGQGLSVPSGEESSFSVGSLVYGGDSPLAPLPAYIQTPLPLSGGLYTLLSIGLV